MTKRFKDFIKELDKEVATYALTLDARDEAYVDALMQKFAQLIAQDCIIQIQRKMPRNGVNSPENLQAKKHIEDIVERYGIEFPIDTKFYRISDLAN